MSIYQRVDVGLAIQQASVETNIPNGAPLGLTKAPLGLTKAPLGLTKANPSLEEPQFSESMMLYFPNGKSTTWGIYRECVLVIFWFLKQIHDP